MLGKYFQALYYVITLKILAIETPKLYALMQYKIITVQTDY